MSGARTSLPLVQVLERLGALAPGQRYDVESPTFGVQFDLGDVSDLAGPAGIGDRWQAGIFFFGTATVRRAIRIAGGARGVLITSVAELGSGTGGIGFEQSTPVLESTWSEIATPLLTPRGISREPLPVAGGDVQSGNIPNASATSPGVVPGGALGVYPVEWFIPAGSFGYVMAANGQTAFFTVNFTRY